MPPSANPARNLARPEGRQEQVDDVALDLGDQEGRRGVGESVLRDRHHDETRGDEDEVRQAARRWCVAAQRDAEDREEEQRAHHRPADRLRGHGEEALDLAPVEGGHPDPVRAFDAWSCGHQSLLRHAQRPDRPSQIDQVPRCQRQSKAEQGQRGGAERHSL
jgi:hypothetical protein